jgi:hypothetical protein
MLPFTIDQFFQLFEVYNRTIWPLHVVAYCLAGFVLWAILIGRAWSWRAAAGVLSLMWLWNGLAYHLAFFTLINPAAYGFAVLFVAQGLLFFASALSDQGPSNVVGKNWRSALAMATIAYALIFYSVLGYLAGHGWPGAPVLGVAPCPTTIFTFGILMLAGPSIPRQLFVLPILWAFVGSTAAVLLGVPEDLGLLASAGALLAVRAHHRSKSGYPLA